MKIYNVSSGAIDCKHLIENDLWEYAKEQYCRGTQILVDEHYRQYATVVCGEYSLSYPPATHEEALLMYLVLKDDGDLLLTHAYVIIMKIV